MIILRYLVKETLKNQLVILFILLSIFFCQKLIKILGAAVDGTIPTNLVFYLLGLGIPEIVQLILPLSLFLSLLITFGKLYTDTEIIVMHTLGLSKAILVKAAMVLALFTGIIAAANVMWVGPLSSRYQDKVLAEAKANPGMAALAQGKFQQITKGNLVLFINSVHGNHFNNVFLAQHHPKGNTNSSIIVADSGQLTQCKDGSQIITLDKGTRFESAATLRVFRITNFQNYQATIGYQSGTLDSSDAKQMNMHTLINTDNNYARAELHWRITLVFTVFMMALIAVPMSVVHPRQGRMLSTLPAMLCYLVFFLLQASIKSNGSKGKIDPIVWVWVVNSFYLILAVSLNLWDTLPVRRFRAQIVNKGSHLMWSLGILDCYIGKIISIAIIMTFFVLVSLSAIIKFVEQLKKVGQGSYDVLGAGIYTLLSTPKDINIFFPVAALIGALLGLGILVQHNELVVMHASGYTRTQVVLSVIKTAIPLVLLIMMIGEGVAPKSEQMARNYRARAIYGGSLLSTQRGLWVKDSQSFVHIERLSDNSELGGVSIYAFSKKHRLQSLRYAATAKFDPEQKLWCLSQVNEYNLQDPKQITSLQTVSGVWKTNLTPDKLGIAALDPDALSISSLFRRVKYLKSSGQDAGYYQLNMWKKIFQPVSVVVMMLMALSFNFGSPRSISISRSIVIGISFGFIFYVLDQIFGPLTLMCGIPPIIGALLPSVSFFFISLCLLLKRS